MHLSLKKNPLNSFFIEDAGPAVAAKDLEAFQGGARETALEGRKVLQGDAGNKKVAAGPHTRDDPVAVFQKNPGEQVRAHGIKLLARLQILELRPKECSV